MVRVESQNQSINRNIPPSTTCALENVLQRFSCSTTKISKGVLEYLASLDIGG